MLHFLREVSTFVFDLILLPVYICAAVVCCLGSAVCWCLAATVRYGWPLLCLFFGYLNAILTFLLVLGFVLYFIFAGPFSILLLL